MLQPVCPRKQLRNVEIWRGLGDDVWNLSGVQQEHIYLVYPGSRRFDLEACKQLTLMNSRSGSAFQCTQLPYSLPKSPFSCYTYAYSRTRDLSEHAGSQLRLWERSSFGQFSGSCLCAHPCSTSGIDPSTVIVSTLSGSILQTPPLTY